MKRYLQRIAVLALVISPTALLPAQPGCIEDALSQSDSTAISRALESCLTAAGQRGQREAVLQSATTLALHSSGNTIAQLGYWLEAERYLEKMNAATENRQVLARIAELYAQEGFSERALDYYQQATQLLQNTQWTEERERLLLGMARAHLGLRHFNDARQDYQTLLAYYRSVQQNHKAKEVLLQMAELENTAGNPAQARSHYQQLEALARAANSPVDLAAALNNIGYTFHQEEQYQQAYNYFLQTFNLRKRLPSNEQFSLFYNLAICAFNRDEPDRALQYLEQAEEELNPSDVESARLLHLSATILLRQKDYVNALRVLQQALDKGKTDRPLTAELYRTGAEIYQARYELAQAIDFYQRHIRIRETLQAEERLRRQQFDQQLAQLDRAEKEIQLLLTKQEVQDLAVRDLQAQNERIQSNANRLALEAARIQDEKRLLRQQAELDSIRIQNEKLAKQQTQSMLRLAEEQLRSALIDRSLAEVTQREALKRLELEDKEREATRQIEILNRDNAISQLQLERQRTFQRYAYLLLAALGLILMLIGWSWQMARRNNKLLARKNQEVESERHKAEALLLNILPDETARELKETGRTSPRAYAEATVLFTDFCDFTALASKMTAEELLLELNECFIRFDEICEAHGLEKIKVIGDSYMCVGGLPAPTPEHAQAAVAAALEMQTFIETRRLQHLQQGRPYWQMRIGIHTGPVVAGVVGKHKFSFDVWGDTVNTASRLEGAGEPGRINISTATFNKINPYYSCHYRGELTVKGKGEVGMYFVNG